jgi:hypothetical protein
MGMSIHEHVHRWVLPQHSCDSINDVHALLEQYVLVLSERDFSCDGAINLLPAGFSSDTVKSSPTQMSLMIVGMRTG